MFRTISALIVPAALLLSGGCSGGSSDEAEQEQGVQEQDAAGDTNQALTQLQGTWRSSCIFNGGMLPYQRLIFSVTDTVFTFDAADFVDAACSDAGQETVSVGVLGDVTSSSVVGEGVVNLNINQVTITALLSQVADSFNAVSFCGFATWVPEVSLDVSGCMDTAGLIAPRTESTALSIDDGATPGDSTDDLLFLGDLRGGEASLLNRDVAYSQVR